jgi:molybdopterin molybdotransferase
VRAALEEALDQADLVLTNGGVSVGDCDPIKGVLRELGAQERFWKVAQKPGGPLGLWSLRGKPVLGIPGNPAAAMLMFELYGRPALRKMLGLERLFRPEAQGILEAPWRRSGPDGRTHFLRVTAREEKGVLAVRLTGPQGSGLLSSMTRANALAVIPEARLELAPGDPVRLLLLEAP